MKKKYTWFILMALISLTAILAMVSCSGSNSGGDDDDGDDDDSGNINPLCENICAAMDECGSGGSGCEEQCSELDQDLIECFDDCIDSSDSCDEFETCMEQCSSPGPPQDNLGTEVGDTMANFTLLNENGEEVSLYDYYGDVIMTVESAGW